MASKPRDGGGDDADADARIVASRTLSSVAMTRVMTPRVRRANSI
jgi:hypothetical protein